jgi:hypothetical protein
MDDSIEVGDWVWFKGQSCRVIAMDRDGFCALKTSAGDIVAFHEAGSSLEKDDFRSLIARIVAGKT